MNQLPDSKWIKELQRAAFPSQALEVSPKLFSGDLNPEEARAWFKHYVAWHTTEREEYRALKL